MACFVHLQRLTTMSFNRLLLHWLIILIQGPPSNVVSSTSAYFVNCNTQLMSHLIDNQFYPSAKRICLCICFNNAGKYCDITLKIMVMLQNMCENCIRISKAPYVRYLTKKVKEPGILINTPKREKPKTVHTPENIAAVAESVCVKRHQHQYTVVLNN